MLLAAGLCYPTNTTIVVFLSPVGQYFGKDSKGETLFLDESHVRAWPGGTGQFKLASNYAPTLLPRVSFSFKYNPPGGGP